jgi:hypothetical protein
MAGIGWAPLGGEWWTWQWCQIMPLAAAAGTPMPGWQPVSLGTSLESISTLLPPCLTGESHEIMMCTDLQAWRAPEVQLAWRWRCGTVAQG